MSVDVPSGVTPHRRALCPGGRWAPSDGHLPRGQAGPVDPARARPMRGRSRRSTSASPAAPRRRASIGLIQASRARCASAPARRPRRSSPAGTSSIVGGSRGLTGAPRMAAHASMRAGAGYVTACVPASLQAILATAGPPEMMTPWSGRRRRRAHRGGRGQRAEGDRTRRRAGAWDRGWDAATGRSRSLARSRAGDGRAGARRRRPERARGTPARAGEEARADRAHAARRRAGTAAGAGQLARSSASACAMFARRPSSPGGGRAEGRRYADRRPERPGRGQPRRRARRSRPPARATCSAA